jgi:hypothetical protein
MITDPDESARGLQKSTPNSNPISPPHNSNSDHVEVAEHIKRWQSRSCDIYEHESRTINMLAFFFGCADCAVTET